MQRKAVGGVPLVERQQPAAGGQATGVNVGANTGVAVGTSASSYSADNAYPALYGTDGKWTAARITAVAVPVVLVLGVLVAFIVLSFRRRRVVKAERKLTDDLWAQRGGTNRKPGDKRASTDSLVAYVEEKPPRAPFMRDSQSMLGNGLVSRDSVASFASSMDSALDDSRYRPASMIRSPSSLSLTPESRHNPFEDPNLASARTSTQSLVRVAARGDESSGSASPSSLSGIPSDEHSEEAGLMNVVEYRKHP